MNQSLGSAAAPTDDVLGWLQEPLAHNLARLSRLLDSWRDHPADLTPLLPAPGLLQEMTGALIVADADAAVPLLEEMQQTAHALLNAAAPEVCVNALEQAIATLADYFHSTARDSKAIPYHLVPLYYALRSARGASPPPRIPRLQRHALPVVPREPAVAGAPVDLRPRARKLRPIYQTSLVHWYRRQNTHNYLQDLLSVLADLERHTPAAQALLWWIGGAVAEALLDGGLPETDATRLLLGQLDPAIKRCAEQGAEALNLDPPLGLMEALLDTLQQAQSSGARVRAVQALFHLDAAEIAAENREDHSAATVVRQLAFELRDIKLQLGGLIHSPGRHTAELAPLILRLQGLAGALAILRQSEWRFLVLGQLEQLEIIIDIEQDPGDVTLMEITSTLSYVENALEQFSEQLDKAADLPATDQPTLASWSAALHHEAAIGLDRVKEALLLCASDPETAKPAIAAVPGQLDALEVQVDKAGLNEVADLIGDLRAYFAAQFLSQPRHPAATFDRLADIIAAIDFFLENLARGGGRAAAILARGRESLESLRSRPAIAEDEPASVSSTDESADAHEAHAQDSPPADASPSPSAASPDDAGQLFAAPDASQFMAAPEISQLPSAADDRQSLSAPPPAALPLLASETETAALEDLLDDDDDVEPLNEADWAVVSGELAEIFIDEACAALDETAAAVQAWLAQPGEQYRAELQHHLTLLQSGADMAGADGIARQCHDLIAILGEAANADIVQSGFAALRSAILELARQHGRTPAPQPATAATAEAVSSAPAADEVAAAPAPDANQNAPAAQAVEQSVPAEADFGFYLNELHRVNAQIREQVRSFEAETGALLANGSNESTLAADEQARLAVRLSTAVADLNEIQRTLQSLCHNGAAHKAAPASAEAPQSLAALQAQLGQLVRRACAASGKRSTLHIDDHEPVLSEPQLGILKPALEQILLNAVTHGIEMGEQRLSRGKPAVGQIDIRLLRNNGDLVIVIRDDGAGVNLGAVREQAVRLGLLSEDAPPNNPELFRLLLKPGVGTTERSTGLAEVDNAVAQLGGQLEITSTLHQGSCVTITLPDLHAAADQPAAEHAVMPAPSERGRPLVMIVDDSITVRKVMERLLRRHDYPTMSAEDGDIALALIESRRPDVVIVDMEMPDINGLTLAQAMDHIPSLNGVPVIMITSRLTDPARLTPRLHGRTFSLSKPYRELDLIELLDALPVANRNP